MNGNGIRPQQRMSLGSGLRNRLRNRFIQRSSLKSMLPPELARLAPLNEIPIPSSSKRRRKVNVE